MFAGRCLMESQLLCFALQDQCTLTEHLLSFSLSLLTACFGKTGCISGFAVHSCERVHISLKGHKRTCNCDVWAKQTPIVMFVCLFVGMPGCVLLDDVEAWRSIALRKEHSRPIAFQLIHWLEHMTTKEQKTEELRMRYWGLIGIAQSWDHIILVMFMFSHDLSMIHHALIEPRTSDHLHKDFTWSMSQIHLFD